MKVGGTKVITDFQNRSTWVVHADIVQELQRNETKFIHVGTGPPGGIHCWTLSTPNTPRTSIFGSYCFRKYAGMQIYNTHHRSRVAVDLSTGGRAQSN